MTQAEAVAKKGANVAEFTVSELSSAIKRTLEDGFSYVRLRGEVSGFRGIHASGHCYFALKDEKAKIEAVIWRGTFQRLKIKPEEGMEVVAQGRVTSYPGSSKYQIVVETLEPAGIGALMALLDERKKRFTAEGLFEDARKRPLPFLPRVVGIVTSPTGAVIRDMLHCFHERFAVHVIVWPVRVQGETSAAEVASAINGFDAIEPGGRVPRPDVLVVARGGGSLEDLWGFNDEAVVRAAAACRIPLISAVGHETDWTLLDLVADARAPTPTKAAEWAVPKSSDLVEAVGKLRLRQSVAARRVIAGFRNEFRAAAGGLPRREDILALPRQRFDAVDRRLSRALLANTRAHGLRHGRVSARLRPGLLSQRLARFGDCLRSLGERASAGLAGVGGRQRARLERVSGQLGPALPGQRIGRAREQMRVAGARLSSSLSTTSGRQRTKLERVSGRLSPHLIGGHLTRSRHRIEGLSKLLISLSYQSALERGFAIVRDSHGRMLRRSAGVPVQARLEIEMVDGRILAEVQGGGAPGKPPSDVASQQPSPRLSQGYAPRRRPPEGGSQGSLL